MICVNKYSDKSVENMTRNSKNKTYIATSWKCCFSKCDVFLNLSHNYRHRRIEAGVWMWDLCGIIMSKRILNYFRLIKYGSAHSTHLHWVWTMARSIKTPKFKVKVKLTALILWYTVPDASCSLNRSCLVVNHYYFRRFRPTRQYTFVDVVDAGRV